MLTIALVLFATIASALGAGLRKFTLTITREPVGVQGERLAINGQSPGPALYAEVGDIVEVTVVNKLLNDEPTTIHWHGIDQRGTPFSDGVIGVTQCPIAVGQSMVYRFVVDRAGTYWYHGHVHEQYVDGLVGPLIVNRPNEQQFWSSHGASYKHDDWTFIAVDYYQKKGSEYMPWYASPASGGNEPLPEGYLVNGQGSEQLRVYARKDLANNAYRVRFINGASFSMFNVSVDGMALKLVELDGTPLEPVEITSIVLNAAQRASFLLDFTQVDDALKASPSLWLRVMGMPLMYPTYDPADPHIGLYSTATGLPMPVEWKGLIVFDNDGSLAAASEEAEKTGASTTVPLPLYTAPPMLTFHTPRDTNFLDARPLDKGLAPHATHHLYYEIVFAEDAAGVNRPSVNGLGYFSPPGSAPLLYDYLQATKMRLKTLLAGSASPSPIATAMAEENGQIPIYGDGVSPFVLPFNAVIDVFVNNTDGGEHPMHLHGHNFWVLSTSDYPEAEQVHDGYFLKRDIFSVPANGWAKIRFVADNPGVWAFHCHIDWHMAIGLFANVIEAPEQLLRTNGFFHLHPSHLQACVGASSERVVRHLAEQRVAESSLLSGISLKEMAQQVGSAFVQK